MVVHGFSSHLSRSPKRYLLTNTLGFLSEANWKEILITPSFIFMKEEITIKNITFKWITLDACKRSLNYLKTKYWVFLFYVTHAESFLSVGLVKVELKRGELATVWKAWEVGWLYWWWRFFKTGKTWDNSTKNHFDWKTDYLRDLRERRQRKKEEGKKFRLKIFQTQNSKPECSRILMGSQERTDEPTPCLKVWNTWFLDISL